MEQVTFEQAVAVVQSLPAPDRERFSEWFQQQERRDNGMPTANDAERFQLSLEWLAQHRDEYLGQWVALDGNHLLAAGMDGKRVYAAALAVGVSSPLLHQINETDDLPFGGW